VVVALLALPEKHVSLLPIVPVLFVLMHLVKLRHVLTEKKINKKPMWIVEVEVAEVVEF